MNIPQTIVRAAGAILLVLGILIWTGDFGGLAPIHMLVGFVLVFALWTLAYLAHRAGVGPGLVGVAAVLGLFLPVLGLTQAQIVPGEDAHLAVRVVHLALGLSAIGVAEALDAATRKATRRAR